MESENYTQSKRDYEYAITVLYRDNLVQERVDKIKKRLDDCIAKGDAQTQQALEEFLLKIMEKKYEYKLKEATEEVVRLLKAFNQECTQNYPRFCERIQPSITSFRERFSSKTSGVEQDPFIQQTLQDFELAAQNWLQKAQDYQLEDKLQKAMYNPKSALSNAENYLKSYGIYTQTEDLTENIKTEINKVKSNPEFFGLSSFDTQLSEFYAKYDVYLMNLNAAYLNKEVKQEVEKVAYEVQCINLPHYIGDREEADIAEKLSNGKAVFEEFLNNASDKYKKTKIYQEFIVKHQKTLDDLSTKFEALRFTLAIRNAKETVDYPLNLVNSFIYSYRFDAALEELDKAKEKLQELQCNKQLNKSSDVITFLGKKAKEIAEFEAKINEKLLKDQIQQETQQIKQILMFCQNYIDRQEFENVSINLEDARAKYIDLSNNRKYIGRPDYEEFYQYYQKEISAIENKFATVLVDHDFRNDTQRALSDLSIADSMLQSHREADSLEYIDRATEQRFDIEYNRKFQSIEARVKEFVSNFDLKAATIRSNVEQKVLGDQVRDATNGIHSSLSIVDSKFQSFDIAACLEYVEKTSDLLIDLESNTKLAQRLEPGYFETQRNKLLSFRTKCVEYEVKESFKSARSRSIDQINIAESYLQQQNYEQAQDYFEKAVAEHEVNLDNKDFEKYSNLIQFEEYKQKFSKQASEYKEKFFASVLQQKFKKKTQNIQSLLSNARSYFDTYKYEQALDYAHQSQDKASKLVNHKMLGDRQETQTFFNKFKEDLQKFYSDYDKRMLEERKTSILRSIQDAISMISAQIQFKKQEGVIEAIQTARQAIFEAKFQREDLQIEESVLLQKEQEVNKVEQEYSAKMLQEELRKKQQDVTSAMSQCKSNLSQANYKDLFPPSVTSAKDAIKELVQSFQNNPTVDNFVKQQYQDLDNMNKQFVDKLCKEKINEQTQSIKSLLNNADIYFNCNQRQQCFEFLEQGNDAAITLTIDYPNNNDVLTFSQNIQKQIKETKEKFVELILKESLKLTERSIFDLISMAKSYINQGEAQRAMESLELSKEKLNDLADEKFIKRPEVQEILKKWNFEYSTAKNQIGEMLQKKTIKELENSLGTIVTVAQAHASQFQYERVLEQLEKLRSEIQNSKDNETFACLTEVKKILDNYEKKAELLTQQLNETLFNAEVKDKLQRAQSLLGLVQSAFFTYSYDTSIKNLQELKQFLKSELEENINYKGRQDVQQALVQFNSSIAEFEKKYQETVLKEQIQKFVISMTQQLNQVKMYQSKNMIDLMIESIQKAKDEYDSTDQMLIQCSQGLEIKKQIDEIFSSVAKSLHEKEAQTLIELLNQDLQLISEFMQYSLVEKSRDVLNSLLTSQYYIDLTKNPFIASLEIVKNFNEKLKVTAKSLKMSINTDGQKPGNAKKVGTGVSEKDDQIRSIFGSELVQNEIDVLKVVSISTSIPAKIIGSLQYYNKNVQVLRGQVQTSKRKINALKYTIKDLHSEIQSINDEINPNTIRDVSRYVKELQETLPEDQIVIEIVQNFETFETNLKSNREIWEKINKMLLDYKLFHIAIETLNKAYDGGVDGYGNTSMYSYQQNVISIQLYQYWSFLFDQFIKINDDEQFLWIHNKYKALQEKLDQYEKFPQKEYLSTTFEEKSNQAIIMHAKYNTRRFWMQQDPTSREIHWKALAQFPLSREYCLVRLNEEKDKFYNLRKHEAAKDKTFTLPKTDFSSMSLNYLADLEKQLYDQIKYPFEKIVPGEDSEFAHSQPEFSESKSSRLWTPIKEKFQGQVIFSDKTIEKTERNEQILKNDFVLGKDEIHMRAIWKRPISTYALGYDFKTKKPLYGPKDISNTHQLYIYFFLEFDGQPYQYERGNKGAFAYNLQQKSGDSQNENDFYGYMQGIRMGLSLKNLNLLNYWDINSQRFNWICKSVLSPDVQHKVTVKVTFQLLSQTQFKKDPQWDSLMSQPISVGEFNLTVPSNYKLPFILPNVQNCYISPAQYLENSIAKNQSEKNRLELLFKNGLQKFVGEKEKIAQAVVHNKSQYFVAAKHWLNLTPIQYGVDFVATFYRNPNQAGAWPHESIFIQECSCYTEKYEGVKPYITDSGCGFGFGDHVEFEGYLVSDEELQANQINRK